MRVPTPVAAPPVLPPPPATIPQPPTPATATVPSSPSAQAVPFGQATGHAQSLPNAQLSSDAQMPAYVQPALTVPGAHATPARRPALYCYTEPAGEGPEEEMASEEAPAFGRAGQMVFWGGGATLLGARTGSTNYRPSGTRSTMDVAPSFGFFLSRLVLVRAATHIWRQSDSLETQYGFGLETGVGFHVAATRVVSLLPELRIGIGWAQHNCSGGYYSCSDHADLQYWNGLGMPILFHLAPHLFIGAGPAVSYTFAKTDSYEGVGNTLSYSLEALIGGWL